MFKKTQQRTGERSEEQDIFHREIGTIHSSAARHCLRASTNCEPWWCCPIIQR